MVGLDLEISGKVLSVVVTEPRAPLMRTMVQHVDRRLTVKQTQSGTFVIGGGWPGRFGSDGLAKLPLRESVAANLWVAAHVLPELAEVRVVRSWGGAIPLMGDRSMIIGEYGGAPGFYLAVADHFGFTLGPLMGRVIGELVTRGRTDFDIRDFDVMNLAAATADHPG
jgi:glycine/D-amino acid oxidase-like deaminating enzyme